MVKDRRFSEWTIEKIKPTKRLVVLGMTFMATMDGWKTTFPKHISFYCTVRDPRVLSELVQLGCGAMILAAPYTDWENYQENFLDEFYIPDMPDETTTSSSIYLKHPGV